MELFKPAWKSKDASKRISGIAKTDNQEILKKLAATDPDLSVRLAAIKK